MIEKVAILDCGGQYTKVIDRKVRELSVQSDIFPLKVKAEDLKGYSGLILSGGPSSVWSEDALDYDKKIFDLNVPVLGICYGLHLINTHFGGKVKPGLKNEYGETTIELENHSLLFDQLGKTQSVLMSHGDSIDLLAPGFEVSAQSGGIVAAITNKNMQIYGVQFHPEVDLTVNGKIILDNFLKKICKLTGNYKLEDRIQNAIDMIKRRVKENKVIVLVSGGVDSAVSAALLLKALKPENIFAIHVDHGFMRKDESDRICKNLTRLGLQHLLRMNAAQTFLNTPVDIDGKTMAALSEVTDPELKRNIIGHAFIDCFTKALSDLNLDPETTFLAQGTLRPDLIESGNPDVSVYAHKIKTHHNDVSIIRRAREKGLVIETNWDWHKDEVRQVARKLGIEEEIAGRQPFPGPGLAIRMICSPESKPVNIDQNNQLNELIKAQGKKYYGEVIPVSTVGVQGDCRSYRSLSLISGNGLDLNWEDVYTLGTLIPNKLNFINRVGYVLNYKLAQNIQNYPLKLNPADLNLLRELDHVVRAYLDHGKISQVFAVLVPAGITKKYSVAIRTIITNDFMTGRPAALFNDVSKDTMERLTKELCTRFSEIDMVIYDVTSKPPATVEWE